VFLGHFGLFIYLFNRINATGLRRTQIKRIEKLIVLTSFVIPAAVIAIDYSSILGWLNCGGSSEPGTLTGDQRGFMTKVFAIYSLLALIILAPDWLAARPIFQLDRRRTRKIECRWIATKSILGDRVFAKPWVRLLGSLPGNDLHRIEVSLHQVEVERLPRSLHGLKIGHLSDLHLTGYMHRDFYHYAIQGLMDHKPDVVVLSGDIIDFDDCLHQVQPLLETVNAPLGCHFVLGNHDRRIRQVDLLRSMLGEIGWTDLGLRSITREKSGEEIYLIGNERPWFDLQERNEDEKKSEDHRRTASLRIGVSHAPDQWRWGMQMDLDLLFCGHTHGGQARFPLIGPLIAPSWYGSRYASGWFDKSPMLMHVSRGLSGTHPLRFNCAPEVGVCLLHAKK
jgi:predicted MPP superfamily phosphohydrolase